MNSIYLLITCLLVFNKVLSQTPITLKGEVMDKSTGESLAFVNIYLAKTGFGTTTNQSGEFVFNIPSIGDNNHVIISHLRYKPVEIKLENVTENHLSIALEPSSIQLNEVIVRPIDPLDIVYGSLERIPQNYNSKPYAVQGFQREYVTSDNKFIQLLEVAFQTKGTNVAQFSTVLEASYMEDKREKAPLWNTSRGGFYTFGWTRVSGIETPTQDNFLGVALKRNSGLAKYYEFELKESISLENKEVYVIDFDQRKSVKRPLLKGTLYIEAESMAIVKLTYGLSPNGIKYLKSHETWGGKKLSKLPKKIDIKKERSEITYKKYGIKWYLNTLIIDAEFDASLEFFKIVQSRKNSLIFHSERIVSSIDTTDTSTDGLTNISDIGSIPTLQNFIKKEYEAYDEAKGEKWAGLNFIKSDTSISEIAKQLKINNLQWVQDNRQRIDENAIAKNILTPRKIVTDLDYLKETLEKVHPGLYWYTDQGNLDKEFNLIKSKLNKRCSSEEFFQSLSRLIEKIHCGHTALYPSVPVSEYQKIYGKVFPLDLWIKGDSAFVIEEQGNIEKGSRILAINGYEMHEIIERIKSDIPSDGYNLTYKEFRLQKEFSERFSQFYKGMDTLSIKINDTKNLNREVKVLGIDPKKKVSPVKHATFSFYDSLQTAMISIPSFSTDSDFPSFLKEAFEEIKNRKCKNLIIDLRNNQGGRDEYGSLLYSYLADAPFEYYKAITVASIDTSFLNRLSFGDVSLIEALPGYISAIREEKGSYLYMSHANLQTHTPGQNSFNGTVFILINGGTFSSAAEFASIAHTNNRAIFIGEETGGGYYGNNSLGTPILTLPNSKIRVAIPLAKYELAVAQNMSPGHGVIPGHKAEYFLKDILQNRDRDLEFCLQLIEDNK